MKYISKKLKDVCLVSGGYAFKSEEFMKKGIPVVRIGDIANGKIEFNDKTVYISNSNLDKYASFTIYKEDVLVALSGATTGKYGIYDRDDIALLNQRVGKITPITDVVIPKYIYFYLNILKSVILRKASGAAQPNISTNQVSELQIPLPPLETQKKIADVLDKAQELIDKRKKQIELLDEFLQSVFIDMFGDPVKNPKGWDSVLLDNIGKWRSGGTPARNNSDFFNGKIPWLTSKELETTYIEDSSEKITEEAMLNSSVKKIPVGSLLLGMYDTAALKSSINKIQCCCNQAIAFAKLDNNKVNTLYVYHTIQIAKNHYKRLQRGVRQQNLNLSMIKAINIICPPLELQNKFAAIVQASEKQRALMEESLSQMENNFNSIMQKAFRGELFN